MADDDGFAISYKVLGRGIPVHTSDGELLGTVRQVLDNPKEEIFDGIVVDTPAGQRFVDAPEVRRIAERRVTLTIDAAEAAELPEPSEGPPQFEANPRAGRIGRFFGRGGWKKKR